MNKLTSHQIAAGARAGFTLLEVMLAVFILSMVMTSLFLLLNQSTRTFQKINARADMLYHVRGAMDILSRDMRSIYFLEESSYNITVRALSDRIEARAKDVQVRSLQGALSDPQRGFDTREGRSRGVLRDESEEYLLPPEIDLSFHGRDGGEFDQFSFVTYSPNRPLGFYSPWGLRRIHYYAQNGALYRTEEDVFKENIDAQGEIVAKPAPTPELIATGLSVFDVEYGFWADGEWLVTDTWNSGSRETRFPDPAQAFADSGLTYETLTQVRERIPTDDLPAFVRLTMAFQPERGGGIQRFSRTFRLFASQETNFPLENILPYADSRSSRRSMQGTQAAESPQFISARGGSRANRRR